MKIISEYDNGNYHIKLYEDGTKEKTTNDDKFVASFPDSIDLKITNYCDMSCPMCHERSNIEGKHGNLKYKFLETLPQGIELAIGGGNPLAHPKLIEFLTRMKAKNIICNMTINETHLFQNIYFVKSLLDKKLIYGLGVSINKYNKELIDFINDYPNTIIHVILGIVDWNKLIKITDNKAKILILGYKKFGRGISYFNEDIIKKINDTENIIEKITSHFGVVGFDNLALKQLHIKNHLSDDEWNKFYMGKDGEATMYINLVKERYAVSSTSVVTYKILDDIKDMFNNIRK